jgi:GNAT superfamily N-acetyltransferase
MTLDADSAASSQDAAAIAALDVARRRAAYRDLRPAALLASLSVDEQTARWSASLPRETSRGKRTIVAEAPAGTVLGYAKVGPEAATCGGMLLLMYVTPDASGTGAGRALMGAGEDALRGLRHRTAVLWVLERNVRARRLYETGGWRADGAREDAEYGGVALTALRYSRDV